MMTNMGWFSFILAARADFCASRHLSKGRGERPSRVVEIQLLAQGLLMSGCRLLQAALVPQLRAVPGALSYVPAWVLDRHPPNPHPCEGIFWLSVAYLKLFVLFYYEKFSNI